LLQVVAVQGEAVQHQEQQARAAVVCAQLQVLQLLQAQTTPQPLVAVELAAFIVQAKATVRYFQPLLQQVAASAAVVVQVVQVVQVVVVVKPLTMLAVLEIHLQFLLRKVQVVALTLQEVKPAAAVVAAALVVQQAETPLQLQLAAMVVMALNQVSQEHQHIMQVVVARVVVQVITVAPAVQVAVVKH
jgi:hypothetical protein